ncbi:MAG: hypothetical protein K6G82_07565 [Ruminococcus sp.]|nr:hypothetical protein [Ruminococcus sp.]
MQYVKNKRFLRRENEVDIVLAELSVDTPDELPEADASGVVICDGDILHQGSIAWVIGTGHIYGLSSTGEWVDQTFFAVNIALMQQLSVSKLQAFAIKTLEGGIR